MAIELAELVQKINIKYDSMLLAEKAADRYGKALDKLDGRVVRIRFDASTKEAEASILGLAKVVSAVDGRKINIKTEVSGLAKTETEVAAVGAALKATTTSASAFEKKLAGFGKAGSLFSEVLASIKIPALVSGFGALVQVMSSLTAGTISFVGAIAPVAGLAAILPGVGLALKSSVADFKFITKDALAAATAVEKYGANSKQAAVAMKPLGPAGKAFVTQLVALHGEINKIRQVGQAAAFPGFTKALQILHPLMPVISKAVGQLSGVLGGLSIIGAKLFASGPFSKDLGTIGTSNSKVVSLLGQAALKVVDALVKIIAVAAPLTQHFATMALHATTLFDTFIHGEAASGGLLRFFGHAQEVGAQLGHVLRDVAVALKNVFQIGGGGLGKGLLDGLVNVSAKFRAFTESGKGENSIKKWFDDAQAPLQAFGRLFSAIFKAFNSIAKGSQESLTPLIDSITNRLVPAFTTLAQGASGKLLPALVNVVEAFLKFANVLSFSPIITLVSDISKLALGITDVITKIPGLGNVVAQFLALGVAVKAVAVVANVTGIGKLVTAIGGVGVAGSTGAKGLSGFTQGLRGTGVAAAGAAKGAETFANKLGGKLVSGLQTVGTAASNLPGPLGKAGAAMVHCPSSASRSPRPRPWWACGPSLSDRPPTGSTP